MVDMSMSDTLVSFETAVLAEEKGFNLKSDFYNWYGSDKILNQKYDLSNTILAPTQSLLQKFIRETRGVHIEIHRNASGYYWSMCMSDGGTDLGWSNISGLNDSGVWDSFEDALENALQVQLSYDLPNDNTIIKHWGNYVEFALKSK